MEADLKSKMLLKHAGISSIIFVVNKNIVSDNRRIIICRKIQQKCKAIRRTV